VACKTGCDTDKAEWLKGIWRLAGYRREIAERLKKERPGYVYDVLHPRQLRGSFQNIMVTYFDFPIWLYRFDDRLTRGLTVNINSYRYQRDKHIEDVDGVLAQFLGMFTGRALKKAILDAGHELGIYPYLNFALYNIPPFRPSGLNSTAQGVSDAPGVGGTDSIVMFSPHMWGQDGKAGSFGYRGPGSEADEVLFHELIHGLRLMVGIDAQKNAVENYDNEEEFIAVVLTNIYLAEKRQQDLRGSHDAFTRMLQPREFLKNPRYKQLLRNFRNKQGDFFDALADIPEEKAWWNPVRELRHAEP
jgi:hypothetical protein